MFALVVATFLRREKYQSLPWIRALLEREAWKVEDKFADLFSKAISSVCSPSRHSLEITTRVQKWWS